MYVYESNNQLTQDLGKNFTHAFISKYTQIQSHISQNGI